MQEEFPKNEKANIADMLLPREQHRAKSAEYGQPPFTLEIKKDHQGLYYFGANHSHNPENHQYPILHEYWDNFLKETKNKDRIVLVEGWLRKVETDEAEAIRRGSEGAFITYLAHQEGVSVASPDLSPSELMARLPEFSREEFLLSEFISYADHLKRRLHRKVEVVPQIQRWCDWQKQQKTWGDMDLTPEYILNLYERILGKSFDEEENFNAIHNPNSTGTRINEVARAASDLRDINVVSEIKRYWDEGKSILVVFGSGHLIIEEPALRELLK
jgi:hypothetical protein